MAGDASAGIATAAANAINIVSRIENLHSSSRAINAMRIDGDDDDMEGGG